MSAAAQNDRFVESAARLLGLRGGVFLFRELAGTKDRRRGTETFAVVGSPVPARACRFWASRKLENGVRERYERIGIERKPFEPNGLSDRWEVLFGNDWTPLGNAVLSDDYTIWEADLCLVQTAAEVSPGGPE